MAVDGSGATERTARWRRARLGAGVAGLALGLAAESLAAGAIFAASHRYPGLDKIAHVAQYGLVFLAVWWLAGGVVERRAARVAGAAATALLLGLGDECFQRLFALRTFDLGDLAANTLGVALGPCALRLAALGRSAPGPGACTGGARVHGTAPRP